MATPKEMVIILTGASRGIGHTTAHHLLAQSHNLILISRTHAALDKLHHQYGAQHMEVLAGDIADQKLARRAVALAHERWGRLDAVIVNHGTLGNVCKVGDASVDEWKAVFEGNVFGGVGLIQASLPLLRKSKGRIIMTSSGAAVSAYQGWGAYGASKAVLNHLAMTLAVEEPDVTTVAVRPGVVDTEMQREIREVHAEAMSEKDREKFAGLKRDGGLLRPEQPGKVIAKLALGAGKELSGKFLSWNDDCLKEFQEE